MHIRLFRPDDAHALTALLHAAYAELGAQGLNFTAVDQDVDTTLQRVNAGQCWVIDNAQGKLLATLTMSHPPSTAIQALTPVARGPHCAWLNQLAVCPHHRGQGLARQLWQQGLHWAASMRITRIGLDTAIPAQHLIQLYRSWGFESCDEIHWPGKTYRSTIMQRQCP